MSIDIGHLLRVKNMIDSTVGALAPDASSARGLTETYGRLRGECADIATGAGLVAEFDRLFPEIEVAEVPTAGLAGNLGRQHNLDVETQAKQAIALLTQLAGWVQGLIDEHAFREAASKPPTGFAGGAAGE